MKKLASTETRLTSRRTARGSAKTSWPKIRAVPPSCSRSVESSRTSVDFPEPFWPRMATHSPRAIVKVTRREAPRRSAARAGAGRSACRPCGRNSLRRVGTSTARHVLLLRDSRNAELARSPASQTGARGNRISAEAQHRAAQEYPTTTRAPLKACRRPVLDRLPWIRRSPAKAGAEAMRPRDFRSPGPFLLVREGGAACRSWRRSTTSRTEARRLPPREKRSSGPGRPRRSWST